MTKRHSSRTPVQGKPAKPYPDFPLYAHATKRWAKKIRGRTVFFGAWEDPDAALAKYLAEKDALHLGLTPADARQELTVYVLCGRFLTFKKHRLENHELSIRTYQEYAATCKRLIRALGRNRPVASLGPDDFERYRVKIAKRWGPVRLANEVTRTRTLFKWAYTDQGLEKPVRFGGGFSKPSKKTLRMHRAARGPKMFEADEILSLLRDARSPLKAMLLLGINCGFGNADIGNLPQAAVDLDRGWVHYPRPKTGIDRRCPLWPETVQAIRDALASRPAPKNDEAGDLVFITKYGESWAKDIADSPITKETAKLLKKLKLDGGRNFYCLRHTFQTIGDEARDFIAVRKIMGHASSDIADEYRERISDERLRAVVNHVRSWLFKEDNSGPGVLPFGQPASA